MRLKWRKTPSSEAEYGNRNISLTTNLIRLLISKLFGLSIKAVKIIYDVSMSTVECVP